MEFNLIASLDSSLLMYRNTTDFCILILQPANSPNLFISSKKVSVWS